MHWYALLLAHVFMLYLISWIPISFLLRHFRIISLRRRSRSRLYVYQMLHSWLSLIPFCFIVMGLGWSPPMLGLQFPTHVFFVIFAIIISSLICSLLVLLMYLLVACSSAVRESLRQPAPAPFPDTMRARVLFIPFALTAAIVEEILYRGFMITYLTHIFPAAPLFLAIIIAAFFFGAGHLQVRMTGVDGAVLFIGTILIIMLLGLVWGWFYSSTGSLIPGMIIHAIFDLRILFSPRHSSTFPENKGKIDNSVSPQQHIPVPNQ